MKKSMLTLVVVAMFGAAITASAQSTVKILVIDMTRLFESHPETKSEGLKLRADEQKAREEIEKLNQEGNALGAEYKALRERAKNPALSSIAKAQAEADARSKFEEVQRKQNQAQSFRAQTEHSLQQRVENFREAMFVRIAKTAAEIAKRKDATLLLDKSGPSLTGISNLVYFDPSCDITEEVLAEINR